MQTKGYNHVMASVETTTIHVRRDTRDRLKREAEQQGKSMTELLEVAALAIEEDRVRARDERKLLANAERAWATMAEMPADEFARDGALTDEDDDQPLT
jgi:hypothetical protein